MHADVVGQGALRPSDLIEALTGGGGLCAEFHSPFLTRFAFKVQYMRGRKPRPTELHKIRGSLNPTRHIKGRAGEPVAVGVLDEPPPGFTSSQLEGWKYALEHAPVGVLKKLDRGMLVIWVEAEDRHRTAMLAQNRIDQGNTMPLLIMGPKAKGVADKDRPMVVSPYLNIITKAALIMVRAAQELGFSPAARPRLAHQVGEAAANTGEWAQLKLINGGLDAG